ncbi:hypothetical protein [Empedobacter brevis]|uniref:hypothetical protein n=1 Tax=Empedobacter brevis TaxID=247 RepID=UPI0028B21A0A|nr:hypothetical protein [Empedobacter brevis]
MDYNVSDLSPSFIQFRKTIDEVFNIDQSHLNYENTQTFLKLVPNEIYTQRTIIPNNIFDDFLESTIDKIELINLSEEVLEEIDFGYFINRYRNFMFSFYINGDYNECLSLKVTYSNDLGSKHFYSTFFTCSESNIDKTCLLTYKHLENHYYTDYLIDSDVYSQIRVPMYYKKKRTEQDSKEYKVNLNTPNNIRSSRVTRTFVEVYEIIANDFINMRFAIVTDTDDIYKDGFRFFTRPFEPEESEIGGQLVISELEGQTNSFMPFTGEVSVIGKRPGFTVGFSLGFNS